MADNENFYLRWSNYQTTVMSVFDSLLETQTLVDVTLTSEGKWLRVHRLVLSAYSDYFKELLTFQPDQHAIIYLRDIPFSCLEALVAFMYRGEVKMSKSQLSNFMRIADSLQIRGLSENSQSPKDFASQTTEEPEEVLQSLANVPLQTSEASENKSIVSPSLPSTTYVRRSKRLNSPSPYREVCKVLRRERISTVRPYADNEFDRTVSAERIRPLNTTELITPDTPAVQHAAVSAELDEVPREHASISTQDGCVNVAHPLCIVTVGDLLEEVDLGTMELDNNAEDEEEGWSDEKQQEAPEEEAKAELGGQTNGSYMAIDTEEVRGRTCAWNQDIISTCHVSVDASTQSDYQLLSDPLSNSKWETILGGTDEKRFQCLKCNKLYKSKRAVRRHCYHECDMEPRHFCPYCSHKSKRKENLRLHINKHHNGLDSTLKTEAEFLGGSDRRVD